MVTDASHMAEFDPALYAACIAGGIYKWKRKNAKQEYIERKSLEGGVQLADGLRPTIYVALWAP